ncbi:hypothetical protein DdX_12266 [Ditylenchus destructor]|uniref:Uncharacterized protein n=1 Tax=Ditylenchus destructor TaxID=166010 RepID=A0AAD4R3L8_9BILA|nr:hypothetical protein DdX_12266 [Ditylenchus destructor]
MRNFSLLVLAVSGLVLCMEIASTGALSDADRKEAFAEVKVEFKGLGRGNVGSQSRFGVTLSQKEANQAVYYAVKSVCYADDDNQGKKKPIFYIGVLAELTRPDLLPAKGVIKKCAKVVEKSWIVKIPAGTPGEVEAKKEAQAAVYAYGVLQCLEYIMTLFQFHSTVTKEQQQANKSLMARFTNTRTKIGVQSKQNRVIHLGNRMKEMKEKFNFLVKYMEHNWVYIDVRLVNKAKVKTGKQTGVNEDRYLSQDNDFEPTSVRDRGTYFETSDTHWWHPSEIDGLKGGQKSLAKDIQAPPKNYDKPAPNEWDTYREKADTAVYEDEL